MKTRFPFVIGALTVALALPGCGILQPIGGLGKAILGVPGAMIDGDDASWQGPSSPEHDRQPPFVPALRSESPGISQPAKAASYAPLPLAE